MGKEIDLLINYPRANRDISARAENKTDEVRSVAKKFATNTQGLKDIFKKNNVNFDSFVEKHEVELLWNTLIYRLYNSQININIIEVNNEISKKKILKILNIIYLR